MPLGPYAAPYVRDGRAKLIARCGVGGGPRLALRFRADGGGVDSHHGLTFDNGRGTFGQGAPKTDAKDHRSVFAGGFTASGFPASGVMSSADGDAGSRTMRRDCDA